MIDIPRKITKFLEEQRVLDLILILLALLTLLLSVTLGALYISYTLLP